VENIFTLRKALNKHSRHMDRITNFTEEDRVFYEEPEDDMEEESQEDDR